MVGFCLPPYALFCHSSNHRCLLVVHMGTVYYNTFATAAGSVVKGEFHFSCGSVAVQPLLEHG